MGPASKSDTSRSLVTKVSGKIRSGIEYENI